MMLGAAPRALTAGSASVIGVTDSPAGDGGQMGSSRRFLKRRMRSASLALKKTMPITLYKTLEEE